MPDPIIEGPHEDVSDDIPAPLTLRRQSTLTPEDLGTGTSTGTIHQHFKAHASYMADGAESGSQVTDFQLDP